MSDRQMSQTAPWPELLARVIKQISYKENWEFRLEEYDRGQGSVGLTLNITVLSPDSYHPTRYTRTRHLMIVPAAAYDQRAWVRWVLDQIILVETHEACEFFKVDGRRPFAPNHGPGRNPYSIIEKGTFKDAATRFTGDLGKPEQKD